MTRRLYYKDAYRTEFDATVLRSMSAESDATGVILDQTCFYPTSGGQPCDRGTLEGESVLDVSEQNGDIVHWIAGRLQGTSVHGRIVWPRRFDHMQQHTGQHILSQAFLKLLGAQTVGFHLGDESSTIDLDRGDLDTAETDSVQDMANQTVFENRPVLTQFVKPGDLARFKLRKPPVVEHDIRIVEIEGFDCSPCGGTHCARTGEVGPIAIRKREQRGQETRIEFLCGWRAVRDYQWKTGAVNELALAFSVKDKELPVAVHRLIEEASDHRRMGRRLKDELLTAEATSALSEARVSNDVIVVVRAFADRDPQEVHRLAQLLTEGQRTIALLGVSGERARLFFARTEDLEADMAALLKSTCLDFGGGGGGQPSLAQGGGLPGDKLSKALEFAYDALTNVY